MTDQAVADIIDRAYPVRLPPQQARVFIALWQSKNRTVAFSLIADRVRDLSSEYPTYEAIRTAVRRLNRVMRECNWPIKIQGVYSIGYKMVVHDPNWNWQHDHA